MEKSKIKIFCIESYAERGRLRARIKPVAGRLEAPENEAERVAKAANCNAHPMHIKIAPSLEYVKEVEDDDYRDRDADQPGEDAAHGGCLSLHVAGQRGRVAGGSGGCGAAGAAGEPDMEVPCERPVWGVRRIVRRSGR